ncbi:MAG: FHA domain-containing protein [Rhodoferax sp.]|nr:FHA domain-containing protein [Rhodoferax sp.]
MPHPEKKYVIGRAPTCDIVLADESVSRIHAELAILDNGKLLVTDCHSTQCTLLLRVGLAVDHHDSGSQLIFQVNL